MLKNNTVRADGFHKSPARTVAAACGKELALLLVIRIIIRMQSYIPRHAVTIP